MAILLHVNLPIRTPTSVMSVPAAAGLWRCANRFVGECISAGAGCDNAATRPDAVCDLVTLTPYAFWRRQHGRHHGSWNNLDRRAASGLDIYSSCMTVAEYRALGRWRRCLVRLTNHPMVANLLLPPLVFVILYRVPFDAAKGWRRERRGVYLTNLALAVLICGLGLVLGYGRVAAVQLPIMAIASIVGVWLFSIQHRFEHAQWMPDASWSFAA